MEETRLFDINSIELNELFDSVRMELKNKNDDYKKLKKQYHDIMDRFPNLQLIFEDDEVFELNKEECKMQEAACGIIMRLCTIYTGRHRVDVL